MSREFNKVICIRVTDATLDKLTKLQEKNPESTISEMAREALVNGIARLEVEKK